MLRMGRKFRLSQRKGYQSSKQLEDSDTSLLSHISYQSVGTQTDLSCFDETSPIALKSRLASAVVLSSDTVILAVPCAVATCTEVIDTELLPSSELSTLPVIFFDRVLVLLQPLLVGQLTRFVYRAVVCMCLVWTQLLLFGVCDCQYSCWC